MAVEIDELHRLVKERKWTEAYAFAEGLNWWSQPPSWKVSELLSLVALKCDAPGMVVQLLLPLDDISRSLRLRLAVALFKIGRFDHGRETLVPVLSSHQPGWKPFAVMALAFSGEGRLAEAIECFTAARDLVPDESLREFNLDIMGEFGRMHRATILPQETSELVAIAKNERPYLVEWVAWHQLLGFDRITIYDNESDDGTTDLLNALAKEKVINLRSWPDQYGRRPQTSAYEHALSHSSADWVAFLDIDEFLDIGTFHSGINPWLHGFDDRVGQILINLRWFGSSGRMGASNELVTVRFNECSAPDNPVSRITKTIVRPRAVHRIDLNRSHLAFGYQSFGPGGEPFEPNDIDLSPASVRHYSIKTWEEFQMKARRGRATRGPHEIQSDRHTRDFFELHDYRDASLPLDEVRRSALEEKCEQLWELLPTGKDLEQ